MSTSSLVPRCRALQRLSRLPARSSVALTSRHSCCSKQSTSPRTFSSPLRFKRLSSNMSFSNADTGSKPADPYTQKNIQEPDLKTKVEDLVGFIDKHKYCMMTTVMENGMLASRAMAVAGKEAKGVDLLFHTNTESGKTDDLAHDKDINIAFQTPSGEWASVSGRAYIETDRAIVKKYYSPGLKAWIGDLGDGTHDGGPDDPRIGIIRVKTATAQYAISNVKTQVGGLVEFAKGVVTGESPEVNKLRYLSEQEIQQWRSTA